ncbi:MAG: CsgG/HfaB family protein [Deltaproteobacteria bacterium]
MKRLAAAILFLAFIAQSCGPSKQVLQESEGLVKAGNLEEAYNILNNLCREDDNKEACARKDALKKDIFAEIAGRIDAAMNTKRVNGYLPLPLIDGLASDAKRMAYFGYKDDSDRAADKLAKERAGTEAMAKSLIDDAARMLGSEERIKAVEALDAAVALDPKAHAARADYAARVTGDLMRLAARARAEEDWNYAGRLLREVKYISPGYQGIDEMIRESDDKDAFAYYMGAGDAAFKKGEYERAIRIYRAALRFPEGDAAALLLLKVRMEGGVALVRKGLDFHESDQPFKAYGFVKRGVLMLADVPAEKRGMMDFPTQELNSFLDALSSKAKKEAERENFGVSYQFAKMVKDIDPYFTGIGEQVKRLEDTLTQRAVKGVAVMSFASPTYNPEAGKTFSAGIIHFLYKNLGTDIKVVEREGMEKILKEYEVKVVGQTEQRSRENILHLLGADYLLFGDVLDFRVEAAHNEVFKTVRAKTQTEKTRNPEYDAWVKRRDSGDAAGMPPPTHILKPVYEDIKYKVTMHKKVGIAKASYRVVDIKGKLIYTNVAEIRETVNAEGTDGVEIGEFSVPMKMAEVPSDIEILQKVQDKAVAEIGAELTGVFSSPETRYMDEALRAESDGALKDAIEKLADAEVMFRRKGRDTKEISDRTGRLLDLLSDM